jgi:hypothetical protein
MRAPTLVFRNLLLVLPAIFLGTSGAQLYSFFHERSDIWWTPPGRVVPLAESHDRVAIYVRGRELDDLVAAGQLRLLDDSVTSEVRTADIGLRFNNWDRVRAEHISSLLISGVTAGAGAALLLVGLIITRGGLWAGGRSAPSQP